MGNTPFQLYDQFNIGIIDDSVENALGNFEKLLKRSFVEVSDVKNVDFTNVCKAGSLEYNPVERKFLLYEPLSNPGKTVFFSNLVDGWYTAVYNYVRLFYKGAFFPSFTIDEINNKALYRFSRFKVSSNEVEERVVYLLKDNRWVFFERGIPLEIENMDNYIKRNKIERLDNEIIIGYLKKAGYDLMKSAFYQTEKKGYLFTCR